MRQKITKDISNKLRTLLTSITGYAEEIENHENTEETKAFAHEIVNETAQLTDLIGDITKSYEE